MIYAVVLFIATNAPPVAMRSAETFDTMAECETRLAVEMPRLEMVRQRAEASLGRPLRMVARCVEQGVGA